jgi:outer membrane lipoprotein SlyB
MMPPPPPNAVPPRPICRDCGVIESVREVEKKGQASGSGAAIGGIAGGVLGNQAGRGNGRTAMTLLGVVGGAIAGHEIEKNTAKAKSYEIDIRFDDGTTRLITQDTPPVWRSGDRVRVRDGVITASNAY